MFGNPETTTGGMALKFYASVRMDVRKIETIKKNNIVSGARIRVKIVKNKMAPPFKKAEFDILFNEGISQAGSLIDMGVDCGVIDKKGTWFSFNGNRLGQGRESVRDELRSKPDLASEIERLILQRCTEKNQSQEKGSENISVELDSQVDA